MRQCSLFGFPGARDFDIERWLESDRPVLHENRGATSSDVMSRYDSVGRSPYRHLS